MIGNFLKSGFLLVICFLFAGCDQSASLNAEFQDASPKIKQAWEQAVKLDKADDYMSAAETYDSMFSMELTIPQRKAVEYSISKMYTRACKQAKQGNPNAKKVVEMIEVRKVGKE